MKPPDRATVALVTDPSAVRYPGPPFSPVERPPEYPWDWRETDRPPLDGQADPYSMVRESFRLLNLDGARFGDPAWNPLGEFIEPGNTVLVKPNFVHHENRSGSGTDCLVTHGAVIRPVVDYAAIALGGTGRIIVGDAPIQSCRFNELVRVSGMGALMEFYAGTPRPLELRDFRSVVSRWLPLGILSQAERAAAEAEAFVRVDLGRESALCPLDSGADRYRVTYYDPGLLVAHHRDGRHEYSVARSVLAADVVLNVAKMKTHLKAGVTGALKNFVGINTNKGFLPHHRQGAPVDGGDEYPTRSALKRAISRLHDRECASHASVARMIYHAAGNGAKVLGVVGAPDWIWGGNWGGNDTLWRMVADLNRIVLFADRHGVMQPVPQRRIFCVVDGIVAGEGDGPLAPTPRGAGVVIAGRSAACVDAVMATVTGFDWRKLPTIVAVLEQEGPGDAADAARAIQVVSNRDELCGRLGVSHCLFHSTPARGWRGTAELGARGVSGGTAIPGRPLR